MVKEKTFFRKETDDNEIEEKEEKSDDQTILELTREVARLNAQLQERSDELNKLDSKYRQLKAAAALALYEEFTAQEKR